MSVLPAVVEEIETPATSDNRFPEGWEPTTLPGCANVTMGQSPPGSTYNQHEEGLPFFQGKAQFGSRYPTVCVWCSKPKKIANVGDVLLSIRAPVGPTNVAKETCAIGRGLAAIKPLGGIPTEYILFGLRNQEPELSLQGTGSTFTAINRSHLDALEINVAPLAEQKRIVAKVEELLARVNAAREHLAKVPQILKAFRQSVLAAACSGRLTEDWREDRSVLRPSSPSLDEEQAIAGRKLIGPEELPVAWQFHPLESVCDRSRPITYGVLKPGPHTERGIPLVRIVDLSHGSVRTNALHRIPSSLSEQYKRTRLRGGEILVSLVGTIGRVGLVPPQLSGGNIHRNLALVAPGEGVDTSFLFYAASSPSLQNQISHVTSGANQPLLNLGDLRTIVTPVPPLEEQHEIVRRVEVLFQLADAIEKRVAAATKRTDKLTQSILAKAFRGELVPTEAELARREGRSYEPASVLLERIQAERKPQGGASRSKRSGGTRAAKRRSDHRASGNQ